ncbi:MAG: chemotaxis protein CheW [Candidatus Neomarinimicrobiota bacterium]|nr:chemotaxis protein CheW [Candidatus Neomarinimicrobiota bacterium]RKY46004.1 MAG: chemotaxis protein CheW [Candidatus Neomarinimicrobiota bacterium]
MQKSDKGKDRAGKYLTFKLGNEEYGIEILKVREIIGMMDITYVPRTPDFVKGVINLRGKVIPVIDLRKKFGLDEAEITDETCIIVVDVYRDDALVQAGLLVDSVSEVLDVEDGDIEDAPSFGEEIDTSFILGMAKVKGGIKILLNIDKVLSTEEITKISAIKERMESDEKEK